MKQGDLFAVAGVARPPPQSPDPDDIRERLSGVLEKPRAADEFPWTEEQLRSWRLVFHNMANWLPEDERDGLRQEFLDELARWERT